MGGGRGGNTNPLDTPLAVQVLVAVVVLQVDLQGLAAVKLNVTLSAGVVQQPRLYFLSFDISVDVTGAHYSSQWFR